MRARSLARRWALTPPFHPYPCGRYFFCATFRGSLRAAVNGHPALWSPDFPPREGAIARLTPAIEIVSCRCWWRGLGRRSQDGLANIYLVACTATRKGKRVACITEPFTAGSFSITARAAASSAAFKITMPKVVSSLVWVRPARTTTPSSRPRLALLPASGHRAAAQAVSPVSGRETVARP